MGAMETLTPILAVILVIGFISKAAQVRTEPRFAFLAPLVSSLHRLSWTNGKRRIECPDPSMARNGFGKCRGHDDYRRC